MTPAFHTSSSAARELDIPTATLLSWEQRGVIGPFARDAAGRRLLSEQDLAEARAYKNRSRRARGA